MIGRTNDVVVFRMVSFTKKTATYNNIHTTISVCTYYSIVNISLRWTISRSSTNFVLYASSGHKSKTNGKGISVMEDNPIPASWIGCYIWVADLEHIYTQQPQPTTNNTLTHIKCRTELIIITLHSVTRVGILVVVVVVVVVVEVSSIHSRIRRPPHNRHCNDDERRRIRRVTIHRRTTPNTIIQMRRFRIVTIIIIIIMEYHLPHNNDRSMGDCC
jgi:hypothetical protein